MGPNTIDLTSLAAVKSRAEVKSTTDDAEIQASITAFSQWLLDFTGQASLNSVVAHDDVYDGNGNARLMLNNYPVLNVSSVTMNGVGVPVSSGANVWGYYVEQSKKSLGLRGGVGNFTTFPYPTPLSYRERGPVFRRGQGNIEVVYSAGYSPSLVQNDVDNVTAGTITLQEAPWVADAGVTYYPSLNAMAHVSSGPGPGEYAVSNGLYVFSTSDEGQLVAASYQINQPPFNLEYAVRCCVALNYKRKGWQDQKSRAVTTQGGSATTTYRDWDAPPEYMKVFEYYQRKAIR
jgi:hypothetical protein